MNFLLFGISLVSILVMTTSVMYILNSNKRRVLVATEITSLKSEKRNGLNRTYWKTEHEYNMLKERYDRNYKYAEELACKSNLCINEYSSLKKYVTELEEDDVAYIDKMRNCYDANKREFKGF